MDGLCLCDCCDGSNVVGADRRDAEVAGEHFTELGDAVESASLGPE